MGLIERFLDWVFPMRGMQVWADELADWEAGCEVWEPDELWAARYAARPPRAVGPADVPVTPAVSVGGPLKSDEQLIEELVADYREFLRDTFRK